MVVKVARVGGRQDKVSFAKPAELQKSKVGSKSSRNGSFFVILLHVLERSIDGCNQGEFDKYSLKFQETVRRFGVQNLLKGSHFGGTFSDWEDQRRNGARLISSPGKILDFGCANGFLLACYQEWAGVDLEPYGIDVDERLIHDARSLFLDERGEQFVTLKDIAKLPNKFQYVFWNVWDNAEFTDEKNRMILDRLIEFAQGGRLILAFYDADQSACLRKINWLKSKGYAISEEQRTENGQIFVALDIAE